MTVSTTFGYSATEDRIWMSCDAWPQRIWITRRIAREVLRVVALVIESDPADDALAAQLTRAEIAERAAAEHDTAINRPPPGESGYALRMGSEAADAAPLKDAALCTRFSVTRRGEHADLAFGSAKGEQRLRLSRIGLHRWTHALLMVIKPTLWHEGIALPDWLTRSYLPPALKALLNAPPGVDDLPGE